VAGIRSAGRIIGQSRHLVQRNSPEEGSIFEPIRESRPFGRSALSLAASCILNLAVLAGLAAIAHYDAMKVAGLRLKLSLRRELAQYRMVMLLPNMAVVSTQPAPAAPKTKRGPGKAARIRAKAQKFMEGMDPDLAGFVHVHPELETIVAGEIFRDIDSGALDLSTLLRKSRLRVSFELDASLHIAGTRIEESSGIPSIDHLAMELVRLLEKYPVLWAFKGIRQVDGYFRIEDDRVKVELKAAPAEGTPADEIRMRIQGALALLQMAWPKEDYEFVFRDSTLTSSPPGITLAKEFEKAALVAYLGQFLQPQK
jgi:hypothetical protein